VFGRIAVVMDIHPSHVSYGAVETVESLTVTSAPYNLQGRGERSIHAMLPFGQLHSNHQHEALTPKYE
jgi:hypothetical protein